jgi:hypothetical protein
MPAIKKYRPLSCYPSVVKTIMFTNLLLALGYKNRPILKIKPNKAQEKQKPAEEKPIQIKATIEEIQ